ncbi:hypothetical protein M3Y94_00927200 [Aphelenchoides besseyi]|nr:hypothetical protein M3Y94_00927200 [Aphelenchoides besseyi]
MADTLEELESPLCYLVQTLRPLNLKTFKCNRSELFDFTRVFGYHRLRKLSLRTADNQKSLPLVCSQIEESIEELVLEDMYGSNTELLDLEFLRFMPNLKRIYLFSRLNILVHRNNNVLIDHLACLSQRAAELPPNIEVVFDLDLMSIVSVTKMLATLKNFTVVKSPENDATAKFGYRKGQTTLSSTFGSTKFFIRFDS